MAFLQSPDQVMNYVVTITKRSKKRRRQRRLAGDGHGQTWKRWSNLGEQLPNRAQGFFATVLIAFIISEWEGRTLSLPMYDYPYKESTLGCQDDKCKCCSDILREAKIKLDAVNHPDYTDAIERQCQF